MSDLNPTEQALRKAAEAATPGPWRGDRHDGTVKYHLLGADGSVVVNSDNGNASEYQDMSYGITSEEDEQYIIAANPSAILDLLNQLEASRAREERLMEALTPSGDTKADYHGSFTFPRQVTVQDEDGELDEITEQIPVPWDTVKDIMRAIAARAALKETDQ